MEKKGLGLDYLGWLILGLIALAIIFGAISILFKVGSGSIAEGFRILSGKG